MAIKPCRECGEEVSTHAKFCPRCGERHPANQAVAIGQGMMGCGCVLTLLVTIPLLIAMCSVA